MAHALKSITERISNVPNALSLEYFASPNFIGLFASESCAPFLKRVTQCFADEVKLLGKISLLSEHFDRRFFVFLDW